MRELMAALIAGVVFGLGLAMSGMTDPNKVLGFLDLFGAFDPSLMFVLGGAVTVTLVSFRLVLRQRAPQFAPSFQVPGARTVDARLLAGAALFGIGWGIAGYCPGPAMAGLARLSPEVLWFLPAMLIGALLHRLLDSGN